MNETRKPLFIAPVNMKPGDEITLLFGKPVLIERDGEVIWKDENIPADLLQAMVDLQKKDQNGH
jgi:hypothetical protein